MKNIYLITPEIGRDKGGIQNWMYFVKKLLNIKHYAYKNDSISNLINAYKSKVFILATWKMAFFIFPLLLTNRKIFIFVHGNEILNLNFILKSTLHYLLLRKNTYFIANSNCIANLFFNSTKRKVDLIQFPFMEINSDKYCPTQGTNNFFTITRLVKRKNIMNVIYAFAKLKKENFHFTYTIAGTGPELAKLQNLVEKLDLAKEIKLIGKVNEKEKENLYKASNYFLLPSIFDKENGSIEGYGIVFIEANSYGIPVLSGNTGGMLEAVENTKTGLHSNGEVDDIVIKIKELTELNFDINYIKYYAQTHDYLKQENFLTFLKDKINE